MQSSLFKKEIHTIDKKNFEKKALEIFHFQRKKNKVYALYIDKIKIEPQKVDTIYKIPFLPIRFFKTQPIACLQKEPETYFKSSGTTGTQRSVHSVFDLAFYRKNCIENFKFFYGDLSQYIFFFLLPSYIERQDASLIYMCHTFLSQAHPSSCFLLDEYNIVKEKIQKYKKRKNIILLGVSFALLDLAEKYPIDLSQICVMETGGLKNKKKEIVREELYHIFKEKLNVKNIHAEYGMTELFSQFYAKKEGKFSAPPWARVILRDIRDPFCKEKGIKKGGVNIIDLANIDTCCFIETEDMGERVKDNFTILGRIDNAELRGCNLLFNNL